MPIERLLTGLQAFYLLRPPQQYQNSNYLEGRVYDIIKGANEPLAPFLCDAKLNGDLRSANRTLIYTPSITIDEQTLRPLDAPPFSLPLSEYEAFEQAVNAYVAKAQDPSLTQAERNLRLSLRLPDPDREPDAYRLHGPEYAPRLLILWGCEKRSGTSLYLTSVPEANIPLPGMSTVLEKLRKQIILWAGIQERIRSRLADPKTEDLLGSFLAKPVFDDDGKRIAIETEIGVIKEADLVPATRVPAGQFHAFQKACREFYARAQADSTSIVAGEKEFRKRFRLPDPDLEPSAYVLYGPRFKRRLFVILPDLYAPFQAQLENRDRVDLEKKDEELENNYLYLVPAPAVPIPPTKIPKFRQRLTTAGTVCEKLALRVPPWRKLAIAAAVVVTLAAVAVPFIQRMFDKEPPVLGEFIVENDDTKVYLEANEPLAHADFKNPVIVKFTPELTIKSVDDWDDGAKTKRRLVLTVESIKHDISYSARIEGLHDKHGNAIKDPVDKSFHFRDTTNLAVQSVAGMSGDDKQSQILVTFNKPVASMDVTDFSFAAPLGVSSDGYKIAEDRKSIALTVTPGMKSGQSYTLNMTDRLEDASKNKLKARTFTFPFADTFPPDFTVLSKDSQSEIRVDFTEPIEIRNPAKEAFTLSNGGKVLGVTLSTTGGKPGQVAYLRVSPLKADQDYTLTPVAARIVDRAGNAIPATNSKKFRFTGKPDTEPPVIFTAEADMFTKDSITIYFDDDIDPDTVSKDHFAISDSASANTLKIKEVLWSDPTSKKVVELRMEDSAKAYFKEGQTLVIEVFDIKDDAGNPSKQLKYPLLLRKNEQDFFPQSVDRIADGAILKIVFPFALEPESIPKALFAFDPNAKVLNALQDEGRSIRVMMETPLDRDRDYLLLCKGLRKRGAPVGATREFKATLKAETPVKAGAK